MPRELAAVTMALGWALIALSLFDWRAYLLPDVLTLPLIAAGLIVRYTLDLDALADGFIGAIVAAIVLFAARTFYSRWRGRFGLGLGDVKLFAAAGSWVSWTGLPFVLLIACSTALVYGAGVWLGRGGALRTLKVPFGPFLSLGFWVAWVYSPFEM